MDRISIILALIVGLFYLLLSNKNSLTKGKVSQIIVAIYTFAMCFPRLEIPFYEVVPESYGSLGNTFRLYLSSLFILVLLLEIAIKKQWRVAKPRAVVLLTFAVYSLYIILNPFNTVRSAALLALEYLFSCLVCFYLLVQCYDLETIVDGLYSGFSMTAVLHVVLAILFPVLGIDAAVTLFNDSAMIRDVERIGSPGTFGHPNTLGAYASYYLLFFFSCIVNRYKFKQSIVFVIIAFVVILLTGCRSALVSSMLATVAVVGLFVFRKHKIFSPSTLLKGGIPILAVLALLWFTSPVRDLFSDTDNLEKMSYARLMHYYCAGEIISDHPLVGVGFNSHLKYLIDNSALIDIEKTFEQADIEEIWDPETFMFHNPIHNIWLILLCEFGVLGTVPILFYIGRFFYKFKRNVALSSSAHYCIVLCTTLGIIVCVIVHGFSDWTPLNQSNLNVSLMFLYMASFYPLMQRRLGAASSSRIQSNVTDNGV